MALNSPRPALSSACTALRQCRAPSQPLLRQVAARQLTTTSSRPSEEAQQEERPRWSYTPERMKGPNMSIRIVKDPWRKIWHVNEDPALLDAMYNRFLGPNGDKMLPDEVKWLAITHKSFDYGRRGFNTRLAYYGRQILAFEATRSILVSSFPPTQINDEYGREPFRSPALDMVDKLNTKQPRDIISKEKMARLSMEVGLNQVVRWKPGKPENLEGSGQTVVMTTCMYAIVGAIGLQHGAEVAHKVVRERILNRLNGMATNRDR